MIGTVFDIQLKEISNFTSKHIIFMMMLHCDGTMTRKQAMLDAGLKGSEFEAFLEPLFSGKALLTNDNGATFRLTAAGEEYLAKLWPVVESSEKMILNGFNDEEKSMLDDYVSRIQQNCMKIIQES